MTNNLKQIRKIKGITQKELADNLSVSKAMISMWESNPNEKIPQSRINQIVQFLKVDEKVLFEKEIDVEAIEREVKKDKLDDLIDKYAKDIELENLQRLKEMEQHHLGLSNEINEMFNEPDKLEKVKRISQILNNEQIESVFDQNIRPFALNSILDNFLTLMEEKSPIKLKLLFVVVEYLMLLDENNSIDGQKALLSEYEDYFIELEKILKN
ncbi:helix-turn-helix domain-containing protein [Psychrobacillus sp. NPDC096426]|uniref:helix-turn-helix domain-containing protein n=1 Tax=Psychrobacillus sp. NPDC096426 TaxID=3364491 RepID=UPI0038191E75